MNITFKATDYEIPEAVRELANEKFEKVGGLLGERAGGAICALELASFDGQRSTADRYYAEATIGVDGDMYRASAYAPSMEEAVHKVEADITREVRKKKGKGERNVRDAGRAVKRWLLGEK